MQALSFREYCEMKRFLGQAVDPNPVAELDRYILEGGFPKALDYPKMADKRAYVSSVIEEIFERDIRRRVKVKNVSVFNQVRDHVVNNFGATASLTNILSDLERQGVRINYGPVLENIVYCYARSLGYEVSVGRIGRLECDFAMRSPEMEYAYVQVAMTIMKSRETEDREYRPLEQIRDNWPKFVITRGDPIQHRSGIVHENVVELVGEGRTFGLE